MAEPTSFLHDFLQLHRVQFVSFYLPKELTIMPDTFSAIIEVVAGLGNPNDLKHPQVPINTYH